MARPKKSTVDYSPHSCNHKKTMFVIESKYGNDGYAFWFKLLELLGSSDGHYFSILDSESQEYMSAMTHMDFSKCCKILDTLANLKAIDRELLDKGVIWSDNFIDGIKDAYRNRKDELPSKPDSDNINAVSSIRNKVPDIKNPQSKVKESKVKETILISDEKKQELKEHREQIALWFEHFWKAYPARIGKKVGKKSAKKEFLKFVINKKTFKTISWGLFQWRTCEEWARSEGQYIPDAERWLKHEHWTTEFSHDRDYATTLFYKYWNQIFQEKKDGSKKDIQS